MKHSFSKEIHNALADYEYEICEVARERFSEFAEKKDFCAINVTIPYKELIIPYIDKLDKYACEICAVNTVVNRSGKLYGYNTDFYGMTELISHAGIEIYGKKVVVLGTGGTSKTALAVLRNLSAKEVIRVSRSAREDAVSYSCLYKDHYDADVIINTTPSGMFPDIFTCPVDLSRFKHLSGVVDVVYNPLRTPLVLEALRRGITAEGGLYMLVAQAVRASEIFTDKNYSDGTTERIYKKLLRDKENIILIGMPACGKTSVGKLLAKKLERRFVDTDALIEERAGCTISKIFEDYGEEEFRRIESEVIREVSSLGGAVISTGGGSILKGENVSALKENGKLYFIDRPLESLLPTPDRPLANTADAIKQRFTERYPIYNAAADTRIDADLDIQSVAEKIERDFLK